MLMEFRFVDEDSLDGILDSDDSKDNDGMPVILVAGERISIKDVDEAATARMTEQEKMVYISVYQEYMMD